MPSFMFNFNQILTISNILRHFFFFALQATTMYYCTLNSYDLFQNFTCMTDSMSFKKFVSFLFRYYCIACLLILFFFVPLLYDDVILVKPELEHFLQVNSIFLKNEMHFEMSLTLKYSKTLLFRVPIENLN